MNRDKSKFASLLLVTTFATTTFMSSLTPTFGADQKPISSSNDSASVETQLSSLEKALAAGDAKAVAALWTDDGLYIDADGNAYRGRAAIEKRFAELFKAKGPQICDLSADALQVMTKNAARADGLVKPKGGNPETRFFMQFDKPDEQWLISSASEVPLIQTISKETVDDLGWLIGKWKAERNGVTAEMTAEWMAGKHFIRCSYEIKRPNQPVQTDCQIIGPNPEREELMFWAFLSNGGTGHGTYSHRNGKWVVEATGIEPNGMVSKAINIIEPASLNSFIWQSVNRSMNGLAVADTAPLEVNRVNQ